MNSESIKFFPTFEPFIHYKSLDAFQLEFDPEFWQTLLFWGLVPCLNTTYMGCDVLRTEPVKYEKFFTKNASTVLSFVKNCLNDKEKAFGLGDKRLNFLPSIIESYCALGLFKNIQNISKSRPLGKEKATEFLGEEGLNKIIDFVKNCVFQEKAFVDYPSSPRPSISITSSAITLLWNLGLEEEIFDIIPKNGLIQYIFECFDPDEGSFSLNQNHHGCLCATYFALKLLSRIKEVDRIKKYKSQIKNFIYSCKKNGGFSATPSGTPTLNFTRFALELHQKDILDTNLNYDPSDTVKFVQKCHVDKGFAFYPNLNPNVSATKCAIQIINLLGETYLSDLNITKILDVDSIISFLTEDCFDLKEGGLWGFPLRNELFKNNKQPLTVVDVLKSLPLWARGSMLPLFIQEEAVKMKPCEPKKHKVSITFSEEGFEELEQLRQAISKNYPSGAQSNEDILKTSLMCLNYFRQQKQNKRRIFLAEETQNGEMEITEEVIIPYIEA